MVKIPKSHPRYYSLIERERLVEGFKNSLVVPEGLLAHGRGEAFDYILGEKTTPEALNAIKIAAAALISADRPVISMNGNATVLVGKEAVEISKLVPAVLEVNIFYRTEERVGLWIEWLKNKGAERVLGLNPNKRIKGLEHARGLCCKEGIYSADWVLLSLEDGDRTEALRKWGKRVIAVDLNPLSRTAREAHITIVDNVTRAFPALINEVKELKEKMENGYVDKEKLKKMVHDWDNNKNLSLSLERIIKYLKGFNKMERLRIRTSKREEMIDITPIIEKHVKKMNLKNGLIVIYSPHTTAGITINEGADPDVARDIITTLKGLVPFNGDYRHYEGNSDAHIKTSIIGSSLTLIIEEGKITLGRWQRIFFCEFDGPRERELWIKGVR